MDPHPWEKAIKILKNCAADFYREYEAKRDSGQHTLSKGAYDTYVEIQTAAQFLREHKPSGCLEPTLPPPA